MHKPLVVTARFKFALLSFPQAVWRTTAKVGVALASKRQDDGFMRTYVVARYSPPGNYNSQFGNQVGDLKVSPS